ncbi:FAD-dependent oxidoreductase [Effusibacillus dendaii]|uniref:L-aspartate oxidase n=1 Tax=Effusibacillus dendaii TaxID=2743772 RepID=A0A7I8D8B8_9BACL|nr:FAD-dependent oxidoreductase [Effusibacillus dendaii]BCJ86393.1 fumarate reductase subunit A [Effusibacillus dendaii]
MIANGNGRIVTTDVLVIGGGEAALRAAIEARRKGANVVMVSKGQIGSSGSSAISDTIHSAILSPEDSPDIFYQDILKGGKRINRPELARALAEDCTARVQELSEFGIELEFERELVTPGHSFPRRCYHKAGLGAHITRRLREYAQEIGIQFHEKTWIVDLLNEHGLADTGPDRLPGSGDRICGALGWANEDWIVFVAGSTILASGGMGRIYAQSDNPIDVSGETIGMAWRHGARLQDMEFVQFYPYRLVSPVNLDLYTKLFSNGAMMRNLQGERFMAGYPRKELETRDVICYQMFKQGKVLLDISQVSDSDLKATSPRLHGLLAKGYAGELEVQPVEHYSIGGISIDQYGKTSVKGLYACGECTGGVHGANRLGGGALTESLVFGARAGFAAAEETVLQTPDFVTKIEQELRHRKPPLFFTEEGKQATAAIRKKVQEIMWNQVGIERSAAGLAEASVQLGQLAAEAEPYLPLLDMVRAAAMVARSALERKESRGAHQVIDFPGERDEWIGNLMIEGEELSFWPLLNYAAPKRNDAQPGNLLP